MSLVPDVKLFLTVGMLCNTSTNKVYYYYFLAIEPLCCMVEVIGCVPQLYKLFTPDEINWVRDISTSVKEEVREYIGVLYGLLISQSGENVFETSIKHFINQCNNKSLEAQHGAILAIANSMERKLVDKKFKNEPYENKELVKNCIGVICKYFMRLVNVIIPCLI